MDVECGICLDVPRDGLKVCIFCKDKLASASKNVLVAKALGPHLECPICLNVPRDGVMLMCINGHNVCAACKDKLGRNAKCPQGRCDFRIPPAENVTVTNLVGSFPFEWPCKYEAEAGCKFDGTASVLESHEVVCKKRLNNCPVVNCKATVSFGTVFEHFGRSHKRIGKINHPSLNQVNYWFTSDDSSISRSEAFSWVSWTDKDVRGGESHCEWALCSHLHEGQLFVWMWAPLTVKEPEKFAAVLNLAHVIDYWVLLLIPVYRMVPNGQKFLRKENRMNLRDMFAKTPLKVQGVTEERWQEDFSKFVQRVCVYKKV